MHTPPILLSLLFTTSALTLPFPPLTTRQNTNFAAGNCAIYWIPNLPENTPMNLQVYDAADTQLFHDTTTLLPSWSNNGAHVLIYELDRWIGIQSQPDDLPAMFAYGDNTRISLDPNHLSTIPKDSGEYDDAPKIGTCAWALLTDHLHPNSPGLMKCIFSCGPEY